MRKFDGLVPGLAGVHTITEVAGEFPAEGCIFLGYADSDDVILNDDFSERKPNSPIAHVLFADPWWGHRWIEDCYLEYACGPSETPLAAVSLSDANTVLLSLPPGTWMLSMEPGAAVKLAHELLRVAGDAKRKIRDGERMENMIGVEE